MFALAAIPMGVLLILTGVRDVSPEAEIMIIVGAFFATLLMYSVARRN